MIWFILFFVAALGICLATMIHKQKSTKEITLFVIIVLFGFADWISIFIDRKIKPNHYIGQLLDWLNL
jgi:hypothetical protein